jgi:PKHD-type hydroxylase
MLVVLQQVLDPAALEQVRKGLSAAPFLDGRRTAGPVAQEVKRNGQADGRDPGVLELERLVHQALCAHPVFIDAVRPKKVTRLLFSRYQTGQAYGLHTDDAVMGDLADPVRSDVAFTLFLSDPQTYQGGALMIHDPQGAQEIRLPAGDAVVYPAGSLHEVAAVESGQRLAAVGWAQSLIRDPGQRALLFELAMARKALAEADPLARLRLDKVQAGLLRMWADA